MLMMNVPIIGMCEAWVEVDTIAPVFSNPPSPLSVSCTEDYLQGIRDWHAAAGNATATDEASPVTIVPTISIAAVEDSLSNNIGSLCNPANNFEVGFFALDSCGNSSIDTLYAQIQITDRDRPILITTAMDQNVACTESIQDILNEWLQNLGGASARDECSSEVDWFQFLWNDNRGNSSIGHPEDGPFIPVVSGACDWSVTVSFFARDLCGNNQVTTATFSTIDTIAPTINTTDVVVSFTCDAVGDVELQAVDNCDDDPDIIFEDLTNTQSADPSDCNFYNYQLERLWTVTDACGNSTSFMQTIEVVDTITPTFEVPADVTIYCTTDIDTSQTGSPSNIFDNCNPNLELMFTDSREENGCEITINRFWQIADGCGSSNILPQLITIVDTIAPGITNPATDLNLTCSTADALSQQFEEWIANLGGASAEDECNSIDFFAAQPGSYDIDDAQSFPGMPVTSFADFVCGGSLSDSMMVDFVFYDVCGNASISTANITFSDTQAPTIIDTIEDLSVEVIGGCEHTLQISFPAVEDDCTVDSLLQKLILVDGLAVPANTLNLDTSLFIGMHEIIYVVSDCAGNKDSLIQMIDIIDNEAPTVICAEDMILPAVDTTCGASLELLSGIEFSDNCELAVISYTLSGANEVPLGIISLEDTMQVISILPGESTIEYTFVDFSGNSVSCSHLISVDDQTRPVLQCKDDTLILSIDELSTFQTSRADLVREASDNCELDSIFYMPNVLDCNSLDEVNEITIRAVDASGNLASCTASLYVEIDSLELSFATGLCSGDSLQLFSGLDDTSSLLVDWIGPNGFRSIDVNPVIADPSDNDSGRYQVTITNSAGCFISGQIDVNIESVSQPAIQASTLTLCDGDELQLTTQQFGGDVSYEWYQGEIAEEMLLATTEIPEYIFTPENGSQQYFVLLKSITCEDISSDGIVVNVISKPTVSVLEDQINICSGESFNLGVVDSNPDATYTWEGPNNYFSNAPNPPTIENASLTEAGDYTLYANIGSCNSDTLLTRVDVFSEFEAPAISGTRNVCLGDTIKINIDGFFNEIDSFIWNTPKGIVFTVESSLFVLNSDSLDFGIYNVKVRANGCESPVSENITVNMAMASLTPTITTQGPFCVGQTVQLDAAFVADAQYEWRGPNNFTANNSSPLIFNINEDFIGDYQVRVLIGGCVSQWSPTFSLDLIDRPVTASIASTSIELCRASTSPDLSLCINEQSATSGASYMWLLNEDQDTLGITDDLCLSVNSLEPFEVGDNAVNVVTMIGSCTSTISESIIITITEDDIEVMANAGEDQSVCESIAMLNAVSSELSGGSWSSLGGASIANADSEMTEVTDLELGANLFVWRLEEGECNAPAFDTVEVFLEIIPVTNDDEFDLTGSRPYEIDVTENDELPADFSLQIISATSGLEITADDPFNLLVEPVATLSGEVEFEYEVCNVNCIDQCDVSTVKLNLGEQKLCSATNVITPNGDGINDSFIIPCLETNAFPNNTLSIFNQWGDEIFLASPYQNDWQGTYAGEELPVGTYFYILSFGENEKVEDGFIQLER